MNKCLRCGVSGIETRLYHGKTKSGISVSLCKYCMLALRYAQIKFVCDVPDGAFKELMKGE